MDISSIFSWVKPGCTKPGCKDASCAPKKASTSDSSSLNTHMSSSSISSAKGAEPIAIPKVREEEGSTDGGGSAASSVKSNGGWIEWLSGPSGDNSVDTSENGKNEGVDLDTDPVFDNDA